MLTFALEREIIETHPLLRFRMLKEDKPALRVMTLHEERQLIECIEDPVIAAYAAVLGETGLRKQEGLLLKWDQINLDQRILSVQFTKSRKPRYLPLSDFAITSLRSLVRIVGCPYVFVRLESRDRWRKPEGPFNEGRTKAGLEWGIDSRLASFSSDAVDSTGRGSTHCTRIARAQFHYHNDAITRTLRRVTLPDQSWKLSGPSNRNLSRAKNGRHGQSTKRPSKQLFLQIS